MEMNRRQFVASSAAAAALAASAGIVSSAAADEAPAQSWRVRPAAVTEFAEEIDADVVVAGAGISGVCAALKAVQMGAKTVVLQKSPYVMTHGGNFGAINDRFQKEAGNPEIDPMDILQHHLKYNNYRPQFEYAKCIFAESAETLEWIADSTDTTWKASTPRETNKMDWDNTTFVTGHSNSAGKAIDLANVIMNKAIELGAELLLSTPIVDTIEDENGRVIAAVAQRLEDGAYIKVNAAKAVILSTGDYGSNYEMCAEMCPWVVGTHNYYNPNDNTGDGHKIGTWLGAKMETLPHTKMAHIHNSIDGSNLTDSPVKSDPFLWVNQDGKRFANEHMEYAMVCNTVREQPGDVFYVVHDANYNAQRAAFLNAKGEIKDEQIETAIELGYTVKADTLEECAAAMDIPAEALLETVARYNELAAAGMDEDFGKPAQDLQPIETAPFYVTRTYTPMDVTMGGLMVNTKMQVLKEDGSIIEGLYATGNTAGGFYGGIDYDLEVDAFSLGRAVTSGRLAAQYACAE
ncbi:MAG: FAD-dependent oxidoreductase [Coriobacteriales bacterium]|nr:FAD-dependent oxidoreductase [Coriobacteriales bacterium]